MALPFGPYQGQDLTNWQAGNKFLPREFYSLNTTPSTTLANTIGNTGGITGTQAAGSYMGYPSYEAWLLAQGGQGNQGGGGGGGPDIIEEDRFSMGMSPGAMSGGLDQAKLPGFGNWAKRTFGPLAHAYSQLPTPTNLAIRGWKGIQRWRQNKKVEEEARLQQEIEDHNIKAAQDAQQAQQVQQVQQVQQNIQTYGNRDRPDTGMNRPGGGKGQSPTGGNVAGTPFAQGGRIGYALGRGPVLDENVDENIFEFMQDQGIPHDEMAETDPFRIRIQELIGKGLSWEDAYDIAAQEFQDEFAAGPEESFSEDQGIASLV